MRGILEKIAPPDGGLIVRTAGESKEKADFEADLEYLRGCWEEILSAARQRSAPSLLHEDQDLVLRAVRDRFTDDFVELLVYLSLHVTLQPGDVILTGTPAGVGFATGTFLGVGDRVRIEVEGCGVLENPVIA